MLLLQHRCIMETSKLHLKVKKAGGRMTKVRTQIIECIQHSGCLTTQADIRAHLLKNHLKPNRSTLFRELQFLVKHAIINKSILAGVEYYEVPHHHHHLVCVQCRAITKIEINDKLHMQEDQLSKTYDFHITNHTLEFFGYCKSCQHITL